MIVVLERYIYHGPNLNSALLGADLTDSNNTGTIVLGGS